MKAGKPENFNKPLTFVTTLPLTKYIQIHSVATQPTFTENRLSLLTISPSLSIGHENSESLNSQMLDLINS